MTIAKTRSAKLQRARLLRAFTLLEVMLSIAILAIAMASMVSAMCVSALTRASAREREVAAGLVENVLEQYRGQTPQAIAAAIWSSPDYSGASNTAEQNLTSSGSTLTDCKHVVRVLSEAEAETAVGAAAGTIDLDADGTSGEDDTNSTRADYSRTVPLRFTITWTSDAGTTRTYQVVTFLYKKG
ncbi:MAG: type II secretion system protein [Planctomycetota bacterium]